MNEGLLFLIETLLLGAGNSIYHAERLFYGKIPLSRKELEKAESSSDLHKMTDPLKLIFYPLIVIFSILLIRENFWLFILSIALNTYPINALTVTAANIVIVPLATIIVKLRGVTLER